MRAKARLYPKEAARLLKERPGVRRAVTGAALHFERNRLRAYGEVDIEAWRARAKAVKDHVLSHLDRYLELAERKLRENGATVHWAETPEEAHRVLRDVVARHGVRRAVKAKSMLTEELGVNPLLESLGVEVYETDLGEYLIQLLGEPPSHIVGPAIHLPLERSQRLFHKRFGTPLEASPNE